MIFDFTLVLLHKGSILTLSVTYGDTLPLLSLRDIFPRRGGSLSSKGEALAKRCTLRGLPRAPTLGELASRSDD